MVLSMKKFLGIIILGLLLSGNAYAECIKGDCKEGYGEYIYENGKYSGNYKKSKKSGKGKYEWNDGTWYEGNWKKDKRSGKGTYYNTEEKYLAEGFYRKNKRDGRFLITYDDGRKYDDYYRRGNLKSRSERVKPITQEEVIKNYLSNRKLEKVEGIWVYTPGGRVIGVYKKDNIYYSKVITSNQKKSGESDMKDLKKAGSNVLHGSFECRYGNQDDGWKTTDCSASLVASDYKMNLNYSFPNWLTSRDWSGRTGGDLPLTRIWPEDLVAHNKKFGSKDDINKEQKDLALIVNDVKKTCSVLGFEEGSEKFADCTLKLYTQKIEEIVAEKQARNQQLIQSQQANTTTQSSSGTNTTIIYDPVRDQQNKIDRGMKMLGGKCTLGVDC